MALTQEVALADAELRQRGGERGLQLGAEAVAQVFELEVLAAAELIEQRVASGRLGATPGQIDDQPGGGDPHPRPQRALAAIAEDLGLALGLGEDQADDHQLAELGGAEAEARAPGDHAVELGAAAALEPAERPAVPAGTRGREV